SSVGCRINSVEIKGAQNQTHVQLLLHKSLLGRINYLIMPWLSGFRFAFLLS
ncbi:hypothetical protein S83_029178, partial [Arachis hypogaea]